MNRVTENYNYVVDIVENCANDITDEVLYREVSEETWYEIRNRLYIFALEILLKQ